MRFRQLRVTLSWLMLSGQTLPKVSICVNSRPPQVILWRAFSLHTNCLSAGDLCGTHLPPPTPTLETKMHRGLKRKAGVQPGRG